MAEFDIHNEKATNQPIRLAEKYASSEKFKLLFAEGMQLVEDSASFLDGPGRDAVKTLDRSSSLLYGTESMRLTTRLMQLASWLLLQRAATEGEMTREQILEEKQKVKLENLPKASGDLGKHELPDHFVKLVEHSLKLQARILRLDAELYMIRDEDGKIDVNPVSEQIELISTALGAKKLG